MSHPNLKKIEHRLTQFLNLTKSQTKGNSQMETKMTLQEVGKGVEQMSEEHLKMEKERIAKLTKENTKELEKNKECH